MKNKYRTQIVNITIPITTAPGTVTQVSDVLSNDYQKCIGFALHQASNANGDPINIQIKHEDEGIIQDYVHFEHIEANPATPVDKRYHPAQFRAAGKKIYINADPIATTTAAVTLQLAFLLER